MEEVKLNINQLLRASTLPDSDFLSEVRPWTEREQVRIHGILADEIAHFIRDKAAVKLNIARGAIEAADSLEFSVRRGEVCIQFWNDVIAYRNNLPEGRRQEYIKAWQKVGYASRLPEGAPEYSIYGLDMNAPCLALREPR